VYECFISTFHSRTEVAASPNVNYPLGVFYTARFNVEFTIKISRNVLRVSAIGFMVFISVRQFTICSTVLNKRTQL